jgi:hypothetical protein
MEFVHHTPGRWKGLSEGDLCSLGWTSHDDTMSFTRSLAASLAIRSSNGASAMSVASARTLPLLWLRRAWSQLATKSVATALANVTSVSL